uniref:Uncharacterized protein n=1 Tax=Clytia hemisphaerica TaxID=252671 RepID=A0A7M5V258_9CNID
FSFMICTDIMQQAGQISDNEWNYFLRGSSGVDVSYPTKPAVAWLTEHDWKICCSLEQNVPSLKGFGELVTSKHFNCQIGKISVDINPEQCDSYTTDISPEMACLEHELTNFQRLIIIKAFREEKVTFAITEFIQINKFNKVKNLWKVQLWIFKSFTKICLRPFRWSLFYPLVLIQ